MSWVLPADADGFRVHTYHVLYSAAKTTVFPEYPLADRGTTLHRCDGLSLSRVSCSDVIVKGIFPNELFPTNVAEMSRMQVHLRDMAIDALLVHLRTTSHPLTIKRSSIIPTDSVILPQVGWELVRKNWHATVRTTVGDPAARVGMLCSDVNYSLSILDECELKVCMPMKIFT